MGYISYMAADAGVHFVDFIIIIIIIIIMMLPIKP
jgi:hypothetical protein